MGTQEENICGKGVDEEYGFGHVGWEVPGTLMEMVSRQSAVWGRALGSPCL